MNSFIYFEDLVANALIEKIDHNQSASITISDLEDYGSRVENWWRHHKNIDVTILNSGYYISKLFYEYPNYFSKCSVNGDTFICLKDGKTSDDLRNEFRSYLNPDMLLCFKQSYNKK